MSQGPIVSPVPVMLKHPILARFDEISRDPAKVAAMRDLLSSDCDARALADVAVRQGICPPALAEHMLRYWANVDGAGWPGEIMAELRRGVPADLRGVAGRRTAAVVVVDPRADGGVPHARRADRGSAPAVHETPPLPEVIRASKLPPTAIDLCWPAVATSSAGLSQRASPAPGSRSTRSAAARRSRTRPARSHARRPRRSVRST